MALDLAPHRPVKGAGGTGRSEFKEASCHGFDARRSLARAYRRPAWVELASGRDHFLFVLALCVGNHTQHFAFNTWLRGPTSQFPLSPSALGSRQPLIFYWTLAMKTERLASHNEAREALVLSVAGVTAIMLTACFC
jgi:hypothetical protein